MKRKQTRDQSKQLEKYRKWHAQACDADRDNHATYVSDTAFVASRDHWPAEVKRLRGSHRPTISLPRLHTFIKLIVGNYRQNRMSCKVLPAGGEASEAVAETYAGLIRNVESASNADKAYEVALECAARGGFGYFRVVAEYDGDETLNQRLAVRPIHNPLTVHFDPLAKEFARQDARYCFVSELVPKDQFEARYPAASTAGLDALAGDDRLHWLDGDAVRVAEVFEKEEESIRVVAFASGLEAAIESDEQFQALLAIGETVVKERPGTRTRVRWSKITGSEVLEETLLPIPYIPVVPVLGEEVNVEGKTLLRGACYYAIDAQRMVSYHASAATESIALAPRARTMMTPEQYEGHADTWDAGNPTPVALYNPDPQAGALPQQMQPPAAPNGDLLMGQASEAQLKATMGVFDASLGNRSAASSGVAIGALQKQGEATTFLWQDNLRKAIEWGGRVMVSWIPHVYDTERTVRLLDLEGNPKTERVNEREYDPVTGVTRILNALGGGTYDVVVTTGPAFASARQEALTALTQAIQVAPLIGQAAPDLLVKMMPFDGTEEIAARVKRALPPNITQDEDEQPDGPQAQQQMMQQQQMQQQQAMQQQQQMQTLQAEGERMKLDTDRLKVEGELAIKREELDLKRMEMQIRMMEVQLRAASATQLPRDGDSAPAGPQAPDQQP